MTQIYDVVIVGAGVFGSWTACQLQRSGLHVALIDAFGAGNNRSSSGGESRIIRMGYGSEEIYTRWSNRSLELWLEFSHRVELPLFHQTGVLWMARENDPYTTATIETLGRVGIEFEQIYRAELEHRYPQINFGDISWAIFEPSSGALMARRAVQTLAQEVAHNGARLLVEAVQPPTGSGHLREIVSLNGSRISADVFVFACGPWLPKLFPDLLKGKIHPTRQEVFFFGTPAGDPGFSPPQMPIWIDFGAEIYGFPDLESRGFKMAFDRHGPDFDPDTDERNVSQHLLNHVRNFMATRFPAMKGAPLIESRVCQYENTSNGDFLIDRHPEFDNVWLVGGGSGHGFKHGPALGEYLAARIIEGSGWGGEVEMRFRLATKQTVRQRSVF